VSQAVILVITFQLYPIYIYSLSPLTMKSPINSPLQISKLSRYLLTNLQLVNLLLSRNTMHCLFDVSHNLSIIALSDCCLMSNEQFLYARLETRPYYVIGYGGRLAAGGRPHRFPHNNFSSVYWILTKLGHMISP